MVGLESEKELEISPHSFPADFTATTETSSQNDQQESVARRRRWPQLPCWLTGGRPMTKLGFAFLASEDNHPVYLWRDRNDQQWLAEHAWSSLRLNAPFEKFIYLGTPNIRGLRGPQHTPKASEILMEEAQSRYSKLIETRGSSVAFQVIVIFACLAFIASINFWNASVIKSDNMWFQSK